MSQPDILVFISDQHTARLMSCTGDAIIETPCLDALAAAGTRFSSAVTSSPMCAPARCSFMTGRLPSSTGVFRNANVMPSDVATLAHSCGAAGYETILCGRMHFSGQDQRHGFAKRIMGDFTPCIPGRGGANRDDLGPYVETTSWDWAKHYGAGDSPVLAYDRAVVATALEELSKPHERPLFMVVGTYGPHHTFVAPPALFQKYYDRMDEPIHADDIAMHSLDRKKIKSDERLTPEAIRCLRAAYYGLIEHTDQLVGEVKASWDKHQQTHNREHMFVYTSDHGEQAGNRGLWGKLTFFEDAVAIPLIISGDGCEKGQVIKTPVSMTDIPVTVVDAAGGPALPEADGRSLLLALHGEAIKDVPVYSEMHRGGMPGRMLRYKQWKYWSFDGYDENILFDHDNDPAELNNVAKENPQLVEELKTMLAENWDPEAIQADQERRNSQQQVLNHWGANSQVEEPDRWIVPESAWVLPTLPDS